MNRNSMKKVAICIPHSYLAFNKSFTISLLSLVSRFYTWNTKFKYELTIIVQNEGWIDTMRNLLVMQALDAGADYLLFLDTDMTFPEDTIVRMLKHFEEVDDLEAVTGLYTWKKPPFLPHVYHKLNKKTGKFKIAGGFPIDKPFIVEGCGFGVVMVKREVFERVPKPWFKMEMDKDDRVEYGEDLYFCKYARMKMWCDPNINCQHLIENGYDASSFVQYNGIEVKDGFLQTTKEQLKKIEEEHKG